MKELLDVLFSTLFFGMDPVPDLTPATSQPKRLSGELQHDRRNGAILDPHVRLCLVSADNNSQRSIFDELRSLLFGLGKLAGADPSDPQR